MTLHADIESATNPTFRHAQRLITDAHYRKKHPLLIVARETVIRECIAHHPDAVDTILVPLGLANLWSGTPVRTIRDDLFAELNPSGTSCKAIAIVHAPVHTLTECLLKAHRVVILDGIQNPANVGAIVRSAAALGYDAVLTMPGTADPFHPTAVDTSVGTVLRLPCLPIAPTDLMAMADAGWAFVVLDAKADSGQRPSLPPHFAIVLGSEGSGPGNVWPSLPTIPLQIPMANAVDSLNVAVTAGIAMFWLGD